MEKKYNENGEVMVQLPDLYEWALEKLENNSFSLKEQEGILSRFKQFQELKDMLHISDNDNVTNKVIMDKLVQGIHNQTVPPDYMSLSCCYYLLTKSGLDTSDLREAINSNSENLIGRFLSES
jgi:hypothetical protein